MEQENLFTASKWDILKLLAEQARSPIELARIANTSVANISQQLRLLEMAGLVSSKRVPNRDKGQPRVLYSLAGNYSYLIATTSDFVDKKLLQLSMYNKVILRIWFLDNPKQRYFLEKLFWNLEEHLPTIEELHVETTTENPLRILIVTNPQALHKAQTTFQPLTLASPAGETCQVFFDCITREDPKPEGTWYT
ncbi:ArsR family transcriptional regulator, partial [Candidatus Woesearchaeota archaeon]